MDHFAGTVAGLRLEQAVVIFSSGFVSSDLLPTISKDSRWQVDQEQTPGLICELRLLYYQDADNSEVSRVVDFSGLKREWLKSEAVYKVNEMASDNFLVLRGTCAYVG